MFEVRDDDTHSAMAIIHHGDVRDVPNTRSLPLSEPIRWTVNAGTHWGAV